MDTGLRKQIKGLIMDNCEKFSMDPNTLFLPTFIASTGYKTHLTAADTALVCGTILEDPVSCLLMCLLVFTLIAALAHHYLPMTLDVCV